MDHNHPTENGIPILQAPGEGETALPEGYYPWRTMLDERQQGLVRMAEFYDTDENRVGLPNHLYYMTVSLMARMLDMFDQGIRDAYEEEQARLRGEAPKLVTASA